MTGGTQGEEEEEEEAFNQEEREEISHMAMELVIEEHVEEFDYPETWALKPGCEGFDTEALSHMRAGGVVDKEEDKDTEGKEQGGEVEVEVEAAAAVKAQLHQKTVSFLLHPRTPVHRMLVRRRGFESPCIQLPRLGVTPHSTDGLRSTRTAVWRERRERMHEKS